MTLARSSLLAIAVNAVTLFPLAIVATGNTHAAQTPTAEQTDQSQSPHIEVPVRTKTPEAPAVVEVRPVARDDEISARLKKILLATGWFQSPDVQVDEGVVFLTGRTEDEQYKTWAANLASNTRDVVAVVNKIEVARPSAWNFQPAWAGVQELERDAIFWIPYVVLASVILLVTCGVAVLIVRAMRSLLSTRIRVPLLQRVISRSGGLLGVLFGM